MKILHPNIKQQRNRAIAEVPNSNGKVQSRDTVIRNLGRHHHNILIGVPTLGTIRYEWHVHRRNQILPINWQSGEVTASHQPHSVASIGYTVEDAQNICAFHALKQDYSWLLLWEDDVLPPFNSLVLLDTYVSSMKVPIVSGLYYSKSVPSWPLVFRRRGNGAYLDFKFGDKVWADGIPTGFALIHMSVIKWMAEHSDEYTAPDGNRVRRVFRFPRDAWFDPEQDTYFARMGTSDLHFCDRLMREKVLEKLGWARKIPDMRWPFLVDTRLFCRQIDLAGRIYPDHVEAIHPKGNTKKKRVILPGGSFVALRKKGQS
jgi:hypothetical protein